MKKNKVIATLAIIGSVTIAFGIHYCFKQFNLNKLEETAKSEKAKAYTTELSSTQELNESISPTPDINTTQASNDILQTETFHDSEVLLGLLHISIGMNREEVMTLMDENQINYSVSGHTNSIGNDDMFIRFDENDNAYYISLETPMWSTSRGLSVEQSITQMEQLYGQDYVWEAFNHKGRIDFFTYALTDDVNLQIVTYNADLKQIYEVNLYDNRYMEESSLEPMDQMICVGSELHEIRLGMSKEEMMYYLGDTYKMSTDSDTNSSNILDRDGDIVLTAIISEDGLVKCLYTDSTETSTWRGIKKGDSLSLIDAYYGTHYTSVEATEGINITYEFSESKLVFGIKENEVYDFEISFK